MPLLAALVLGVCVAQNRADTYGKSNAQILAMGRTKWYAFYTDESRGGQSTAGMTSASGLYGDALAWRNDRKGPKAKVVRWRKLLQDTKNDAVGVGSALTGGGTLWNITASSLYCDAEETLYALLTKTGKAPKRKTSDVTRALDKLGAEVEGMKGEDWNNGEGPKAMARLRKDVAAVFAEAKTLPRRESDVFLEFCRRTIEIAQEQGADH